jgi:hypothetical protein
MSVIKVNNITNLDGTSGPVFSGITTVSSTSHFVVPVGNTFRRSVIENVVNDGLVLYLDAGNDNSYPGIGTSWTDLSGQGITGTLTNGPTYSSANRGSIVFDGSNDYVSLGTPSLLNGVQVPITICVWAKANSFSSYNILWGVYKSTTPGQLYSLLRVDNGILTYYTSFAASSYQNQGTLAPSTNVWNFYAVTVSGSISSPLVTLYLNNSSQTFSYSSLNSSPDLTVEFKIGGAQSSNEIWNGNIANVSWYNRALSAAEVAQNYNALKDRYV